MRIRLVLAGLASISVAAIVHAAAGPELLRLTPTEIAAMPSISAGAGTSA